MTNSNSQEYLNVGPTNAIHYISDGHCVFSGRIGLIKIIENRDIERRV